MKKKVFYLFVLIFCLSTMLPGCKEDDDVIEENPVESEDLLAGKTYEWKQGFPYNSMAVYGGWIGDDVYTYKYDTLIHSMDICFAENKQVVLIETIEAVYSSAYRYIPVTDTDDMARIPFVYPENWSEFDTSWSKTIQRTVDAHYSGDIPSVIINLDETYNTMNTGSRPDYNYKFFGWNSTYDYDIEFSSIDTLTCSFPYNLNNNVDTLKRQFVIVH